MQTGIATVTGLEPGRWNLTFFREGRIALGFPLENRCLSLYTGAAGNRGFTCGGLVLMEPTAFMVRSLDPSANYDYRVDGEVDSHFYDMALQPIGDGPVIRIRGFDSLIIVLVPRRVPIVVDVSAAFPRPPVSALVLVRRSRRRRDVITADDAEGTLK
jgi:hypothetical protein